MQTLMKKIKYKFNNEALLKTALTHSSYANESKVPMESYERLEFLGDSILQFVSSEFIFNKFPTMPEGDMSKLRASLVCEPALAEVANMYNLGDYINLSKGEKSCNGVRNSILCDIVESVIAAIFIDGGLDKAKKFILDWFPVMLEKGSTNHLAFVDYKTKLQEVLQNKGLTVTYIIAKEEGPDHDKVFTVNAMIDDEIIGIGKGKSKKAAEQEAAKVALEDGKI